MFSSFLRCTLISGGGRWRNPGSRFWIKLSKSVRGPLNRIGVIWEGHGPTWAISVPAHNRPSLHTWPGVTLFFFTSLLRAREKKWIFKQVIVAVLLSFQCDFSGVEGKSPPPYVGTIVIFTIHDMSTTCIIVYHPRWRVDCVILWCVCLRPCSSFYGVEFWYAVVFCFFSRRCFSANHCTSKCEE